MAAGSAWWIAICAVLLAAPATALTDKGGVAVQGAMPPPPPPPLAPPDRKPAVKRPPVASPPSTPRGKKKPNLRADGPDASIEVTFFDIGQGSCAMVTCPRDGPVPDGPGGGRYAPILIDCGTSAAAAATADADFVRDRLAAAVNQPGSGRPRLVVSHPDTDHYNMIQQVMAGELQPRAAWLGGNWGTNAAQNAFLAWVQGVTTAGGHHNVHRGFPANSFNCGTADPVGPLGNRPMLQCGDARLSVLTVNRGTSSNAKSLVLNIGYGANSVTIAGDAQGVTQVAAANNCQAQTAHTTILSASHHGARSYQSNNLAWAQATRPRYVVFQAGQHAGHAHPRVDAWVTYLQDHHTHPRVIPPNGDGSQDIILFGYSDTNAPGGTGIRPTNRYLLNTRTVGSIRFRWTRDDTEPDVACRFAGNAFHACTGGIQPNAEMIGVQLPGPNQGVDILDAADGGPDDPG